MTPDLNPYVNPYVQTKAQRVAPKHRREAARKNHKQKNTWVEHYRVFGAY